MAGKIKKLLENELVGGTQTTDVYPVTSVKAVYDESNERLDHILNRRGTVNISTNYNDDHIAEVLTLSQAINKVPANDRTLGFVGTFLTSNGWKIYQFNGDSLTKWLDESKWLTVQASTVDYDNSQSGVKATNVQEALDEMSANKVDAYFVYTYNIYDISKRKHGKRLNSAAYRYYLIDDTSYTTTNEIPVEGSQTYYTIRPATKGYNGSIVWLDSNKEWISGGDISDNKWSNEAFITAPENASYLVMSYYDPDNVNTGGMVAQSNEALPYKEYAYKYIKPDNLLSSEHIEEVKEALMPAIEDEVSRLDTTDNEIKVGLAAETTRAKAAEEAIIFDVSAHNNGAVFESLQAILISSNLSTLIPTSVRHGGMTIKFIQGSVPNSDNKYVRYNYILNSTAIDDITNVKNWIVVDVAVKSHGVNLLDNSTKKHGARFNAPSLNADINNQSSSADYTLTPYVEVSEGASYYTLRPITNGYKGQYCWFNVNKEWIAGDNFPDKWSYREVLVAPSNAKYFRMSYYDPNTVSTGVMVAESAVEVPYEEYKAWDSFSNDITLNTAHIEQVFNSPKGQKVLQIDDIDKRVSTLEGDAETSITLTPDSNITGMWSGSVGETITTVSNQYRRRYNKLSVDAGKRYAIINVNGFCAITDENDVILEISSNSVGNVLHTWTFVVPEGGAYVYVTGFTDVAPILYNIVNDNKVVLRQGKKLAYTLDSPLTKDNSIEMFKENPYVIPMAGSGSVTMTLGTSQNRVGMWISMTSFDAFKFQVGNTLTIKFKDTDGTVLRTVTGSGDVAFNYYFSLKRNMFLHWSETVVKKKCATIEIAWNISDENVSANMMLYPYAIKDFIVIPTALINLEHWSNGREKIEAYINNGIKVTVTGSLPSTDDDIKYAREQCGNGMMDYGIYGNESNTSDSSLMESTPINAQFEYAMEKISNKHQITDKVLSYGAQQHRTGINGNHAAKVAGIKSFRNYGIVGYIPFVSQDDNDCVCIEMTHTGDKYYNIESYGVSGFFSHTADLTPSTTNIDYLKRMIDSNLAQSMTMRELYERCIDEFTIEEYE